MSVLVIVGMRTEEHSLRSQVRIGSDACGGEMFYDRPIHVTYRPTFSRFDRAHE